MAWISGLHPGTAQHLAERCRDDDCPRLPCRMWKDGYQRGAEDAAATAYASGFAAGAAQGYAQGYSDGAASESGR
jgi:hypothetical protein